MDAEITVPDLGEGSPEATFVGWLKPVGEPVRAGEAIAEVMTQKVNLEVESPADGVLHAQLAEPDQTVVPGAVIGIVRAH